MHKFDLPDPAPGSADVRKHLLPVIQLEADLILISLPLSVAPPQTRLSQHKFTAKSILPDNAGQLLLPERKPVCAAPRLMRPDLHSHLRLLPGDQPGVDQPVPDLSLPCDLEIRILPDPLVYHSGAEIPPVGHSRLVGVHQAGPAHLRLLERCGLDHHRDQICLSVQQMPAHITAPRDVHPFLSAYCASVYKDLGSIINAVKTESDLSALRLLGHKDLPAVHPCPVACPLAQLGVALIVGIGDHPVCRQIMHDAAGHCRRIPPAHIAGIGFDGIAPHPIHSHKLFHFPVIAV